jgi:uncharacterized protein HemX
MLSLLIGWLAPTVGEKWAKPVAIGGLVALLIAILSIGKCTYDKSVIRQHEQKAALQQAQRERKADSNLQVQKGRDEAASQQRQQEIDNATRDIPDQAPSARQHARACLELQRQAKQRGKPKPAC